jgi:hypothetical protein
MRSSSAGSEASIEESGGGSAVRMASLTLPVCSPAKALRPVHIS